MLLDTSTICVTIAILYIIVIFTPFSKMAAWVDEKARKIRKQLKDLDDE